MVMISLFCPKRSNFYLIYMITLCMLTYIKVYSILDVSICHSKHVTTCSHACM